MGVLRVKVDDKICEICSHKLACRRTKRVCSHLQMIDMWLSEYPIPDRVASLNVVTD